MTKLVECAWCNKLFDLHDVKAAARHESGECKFKPSLMQRLRVRLFGGEGTIRDLFR